MSYLLDALRKSDARRRMGQAPGLDNAPTAGVKPRRGARRGRLAILLSVAVVLVVVVAASRHEWVTSQVQLLVGGSTAEQPAQPSPVPPADDSERGDYGDDYGHEQRVAAGDVAGEDDASSALPRERVLSDPEEIDIELSRLLAESPAEASEEVGEEPTQDERRRAPTPRTAVSAPAPRRDQARGEQPRVDRARAAVDPEDTERMERLMRAREARLAESGGRAAEPSGGRTAPGIREPGRAPQTVAPSAEPWSPGGPEYVRVWELPLSIRRNLPELKLSIHVFAAEEDRRFVLVNGERFMTGDMITDSVRLVDIRREGAVVDFRDYRFLLEP